MLIAIEGLIGIGKSTLQAMLLKHYLAQPLKQQYSNHPYLNMFYDNPSKLALETIMIFLFMGYHQLHHLNHDDSLIISDFTFEKSKVFAPTLLSEEDYTNLFIPCYDHLYQKIKKPDLTIFMRGSAKLALSRIRSRNRQMEARITENYLLNLDKMYGSILINNSNLPLITLNADENDYLNNASHVEQLIEIMEMKLPDLQQFRKK